MQELSEPEELCLNFSKVPFAGTGNVLRVFKCKLNNLGMQGAKRARYCGKNVKLSQVVSLRQHPDATLDVLFFRNADGQGIQKESAYRTGKLSVIKILSAHLLI